MNPTIDWIDAKFGARPVVAEANKRALKAGYAFGETTEIFHTHYRVKPAKLRPGHVSQHHRQRGRGARASWPPRQLAGRPLFYGSYPITPASDILHQLSGYKAFGVKTFQAEDEIAAIGAAIGASYGGALGMTASSGPGIALKTEAMGLAVMVELPARGHRRPARRSLDRHADQDRAGRPAAGHVRAQLGLAHPDRRSGHARRMLRPGHRGLAPGPQVHDPGRLPVRRVPGHRFRAVAHPGRGRPARHRGPERRRRATARSGPTCATR